MKQKIILAIAFQTLGLLVMVLYTIYRGPSMDWGGAIISITIIASMIHVLVNLVSMDYSDGRDV